MSTAKFLTLPFGEFRRRLDQSLIYDWAMRCPIMLYCSFILFRDVAAFCQQALQDPTVFEQFDSGITIAMLARISMWMFVALQSILPLFRLRPIRKSDEIMPRLAALIAVCMPLMFMQLNRAEPNITFNLLSVFFCLIGNVMCVVTISFLGRSFSVMPEARRLVQSGPYGIIRHPLYLCEMVATAGVALQYRSLSATGLVLVLIALQWARARSEERVLARTFPDYADYRSHTSFLIPSDPGRFLASFMLEPLVRRRSALVFASMVAILAVLAIALPRLIA